MVGKILGNRYRVLREIGSGGMAWVYLAEDTKESHLVAIKVLYPQFGQDLTYVQRFNREAKLASTLTDPHIVRVLDYGADRDINYLVMEYIEGEDLRAMLSRKGPLPWKEALEIIDQLATAMEHAHLHGVVHRDIKPQNMMLTEEGLLKVLDFGIARVPTLPSLTQSGFIGSPYYVSPEQAMGDEVDARSDIYSSGIVLYELLSGSIPFDAKSPWSIISQHIASEPPPIDLPQNDIPANVQDLLKRMIAKKPQERFQTSTILRQSIAAVLAGRPVPDHVFDTQPVFPFDPLLLADSLYHRALEAIDAKEWARAADLLSQVLHLDPTHAEAREKLSQAEQEAFLLSLYNAAKRAMKNSLWEEAINNLVGIVEIEPNFRDTGILLVEARRALEIENGRQLVITRYNEGMAHFEAGRWGSAVEAFQEVKRLSPGYQRVDQLLAEAERQNKLSHQIANGNLFKNVSWRWVLVIIGLIIIFILTLGPAITNFGPNNGETSIAGNNDPKQQLKILYEQAQQSIQKGDKKQAITLLDQILAEDPDYADAASLKRELAATPTPTPTTTPLPTSTPTLAPTPTTDTLGAMLDQAEGKIEVGDWTQAILVLKKVHAANAEYEKARLATLLCDAYAGRGLETIGNLTPNSKEKKKIVQSAVADFEAGTKECPRRTDLQDQAGRATAYLQALDIKKNDFEKLIQTLTPVVAVEPNYAGGDAKNLLYQAYLYRGDTRQEQSEIVGALSDYEAALALNVNDPSEAQTRRAKLLLSFSSQQSNQSVTQPSSTVTASISTSQTIPFKYGEPKLLNPDDYAVYAGRFTVIILEWEPVGKLAEDEYYDLTIQYIYGNDFVYWGTATKETSFQVTPDIGLGKAGGDRFRWYVTVRKTNTAAFSENKIDFPLSRQSKIRTFVWSP